jgi:opacity protein-like surface antigen
MTVTHRCTRALCMMALGIALSSSAAFGQSQVRVLRDQSTIWRQDAPVVATTVKAGTVLDVVGRVGRQYVVVIPPEYGGKGDVGLIAVSQVEVVEKQPSTSPVRARPPSRPAAVSRSVEAFGFGDVGYGSWLARNTFSEVLGSSRAPMFGGGFQVRHRNLFIEGSVERFEKTGDRVAVIGGEVFNLGIADTVRIIPLSATVGYRYAGRRVTPYAGGGVGTYLYKESSDFADPSENVSEHFMSYHVVGGLEFVSRGWVRAAFELQFATVPGALGDTGASAMFNERNLGNLHGRVKILVGR